MTYTAITIGPIYDTISLTSSPAGLWASSYMFSYISRRLCKLICDENLVNSCEDIITPFFSTEEEGTNDGIGRYPDRIIFKPKEGDSEQNILNRVENCFGIVTEEIAKVFDDNPVEWFKEYLQLHAICFNSTDNPILDCAVYLDAIELEKTFPVGERDNPLKELFENKNKNLEIGKKIRDELSGRQWPFRLEQCKSNVPDMEYITGRSNEDKKDRRKINSYYAIVQSDGDKFTKYIEALGNNNEAIRNFSEKCIGYCSDSVNLIKEYGGIPIYAGGDDLLFIAPLTKKNGTVNDSKNIIELLVDLREIFDKSFYKKEGDPTISFGVAIRYYKYPLYEAFDEVYKLLMDKAKDNRNAAAISLVKHSGQKSEFVLEEFKNPNVTNKLNALVKGQIEKKDEDILLQSIRTNIQKLKQLFITALGTENDKTLENIFTNSFDSEAHKKGKVDINNAYELFKELPKSDPESKLKMMDDLLRFAKFWSEKGDENNENIN